MIHVLLQRLDNLGPEPGSDGFLSFGLLERFAGRDLRVDIVQARISGNAGGLGFGAFGSGFFSGLTQILQLIFGNAELDFLMIRLLGFGFEPQQLGL